MSNAGKPIVLPPDVVIRNALAARKRVQGEMALTATREELLEREITRLAKILVAWQHAELAKRLRAERGKAA